MNPKEAKQFLIEMREKYLRVPRDKRIEVVAILAVENDDGSMSYDISAWTHCPGCTIGILHGSLDALVKSIASSECGESSKPDPDAN